jgi:alcohol dehydrogenase (cytochrome c)
VSDETHTNILAYILRSNKFESGDVALPSDMDALGKLTIPKIPGMDYDPVVPVVKTPEQTALLANLPAVTDEMLRSPSPNDWLHWGRTYDGQSYSPLKQINKETVKGLETVWRAPLQSGSSMPMPVVHGGVMYLHTFPETVLAMDATNGDVLWRYKREGNFRPSKKMGLALHEGRVYTSTSDLHVIALDAKTGELVWDHKMELGHSPETYGKYVTRSAPLIAGDVVIQGTGGYRLAKGSFIVGIDRESGKEAWRFNTLAWPGQPGGNTWNDIPVEERNGGSCWQLGTYDPESNLVYFGVAPTYDTAPLLVPTDKEGHTNEGMYTNCTVALNADTGELVWYYQHMANDQWDLDWVFERQIATISIDGVMRKVVMNVGKVAILDALDAATGEYLFSVDTGMQNVISAIDPETGAKTYHPEVILNSETPCLICPNTDGARNWPPTSYSPQTKLSYVPVTEWCNEMSATGKGGGLLSTGVHLTQLPHPDASDGMLGRIQAIDLENQELAWNHDLVSPPISGLLATAGGVLFSGDLDPSLKAFDDATGELLWQAALGAAPSSGIVTYSVKDTQYVAVVVGAVNDYVRGMSSAYYSFISSSDTPSNASTEREAVIRMLGEAAIWVFALGGTGS